jgi:hypothetical protein
VKIRRGTGAWYGLDGLKVGSSETTIFWRSNWECLINRWFRVFLHGFPCAWGSDLVHVSGIWLNEKQELKINCDPPCICSLVFWSFID